jgi:hypothetical protein
LLPVLLLFRETGRLRERMKANGNDIRFREEEVRYIPCNAFFSATSFIL